MEVDKASGLWSIFWADLKEEAVVIVMGVAPEEIRKVHREQLNTEIYEALAK